MNCNTTHYRANSSSVPGDPTVKARVRRPLLARQNTIELGPLRIDTDARAVSIRGEAVDLTRAEYELVLALARRPGAAISRQWLAENVLDPDRDGAERGLDAHVSRIRKKLGPGVIDTVWGIGYRLAIGPT